MRLYVSLFTLAILLDSSTIEAHLRRSEIGHENDLEAEEIHFWDRFMQEASRSILDTETSACCHPKDFLYCFIGEAGCCPDGKWACTSDATGEIYICSGQETKYPQGRVCNDGETSPNDGAPTSSPSNSHSEPVAVCPLEAKICPDGVTAVDRVPPNCNFAPCPGEEPVFCAADVQKCPDGSYVSRDPQNNCEFRSCPSGASECCDPFLEPGTNGNPFCTDGYVCCPTGEWSCGIDDGSFPCGDSVITTGPFSEACDVGAMITTAPSQ